MITRSFGSFKCRLTIFISFIIILLTIIEASLVSDNPYNILGVNKYATLQDIRKAYKEKAKKWHPDKNSNPEAEKKFVEIKKAYEILSDNDRRRIYNQYGITNEDSQYFKKKHDYSQYNRYSSHPFEELFETKMFFEHDVTLLHKLTVNSKYFHQTILHRSNKMPFIILFYNDWCFECMRRASAYKKLKDTLEPYGVQVATINAAYEQDVVHKSGVTDVPSLILLLNGHSYIYRESLYTAAKISEFIRKKMPENIVHHINDLNVQNFLDGWEDNRIRALIFEPRSQTRLRYIISAFRYRTRIAFGFVFLSNSSKIIQERYKIQPNLDTILIFNEYCERPVAAITMADIPLQTINNIILTNKFLTLPRLSSQEILDDLCPAEWNRARKRLCVVLITKNCKSHDIARGTLREIALSSEFSSQRVRFAYIFMDKQTEFVNAISNGYSDSKLLRIVVIWRRDSSRIKYEWIDNINLSNNFNSSSISENNDIKKELDNTIKKLLRTTEALYYETYVEALIDEHTQGIISKLLSKFIYITEYLSDNMEQEHVLAIASLLGTIIFMFVIGYAMVYFVRVEEQQLKVNGGLAKNGSVNQNRYIPELKLYELRAEKYNGMVRLLKPGCRTIILITDLQTRPKLIPLFHKSVWPYRKTKTLLFGHMLIEKGLSWYSEILRLSLSENKDLEINPRNCVGTVIALNGHRKYFCIYHAKHPETVRGDKRILSITKRLIKKYDDPEFGSIINYENSDESDAEQKILLEGNLLDGLNLWLDRLFEGSTQRYFINYWPDFPTK
ncbi:dnaJ homolog subfamily C member 16 [Teleopsis dalmanni]|uniref:dnaJ homolog subfamily C member 16 n=1 Tax=Teleopsis dalmanni TaxID=139649 RepID=UPI0018CE30EB|nr:dnaJ homolog subfamily C member 16 [Teleopsis dalmanni]